MKRPNLVNTTSKQRRDSYKDFEEQLTLSTAITSSDQLSRRSASELHDYDCEDEEVKQDDAESTELPIVLEKGESKYDTKEDEPSVEDKNDFSLKEEALRSKKKTKRTYSAHEVDSLLG